MLTYLAHWHFIKPYLTTEMFSLFFFLLPMTKWKGSGGLGFFAFA